MGENSAEQTSASATHDAGGSRAAVLAAGAPLSPAVRLAAVVLSEAGVPSARRDAELLAGHLLKLTPGELSLRLLMGDTQVPEGYGELIARRASRVPLQHLTGVAYFRHLELAVGPGVFIPRPETETVVQWGLDRAAELVKSGVQTPLLVDLGTGSGAIAASLASELPQARVHAVELSDEAFTYAKRNTEPHGVVLVQGDLATAFPELNGTVHVVVTNPPYIPARAIPREPEVHLHDPSMALYGGGEDGMQVPDAAISTAARLLVPGGHFIMEHAEVQAGTIIQRLQDSGLWEDIQGHQDLNGKDRATSARLRESMGE